MKKEDISSFVVYLVMIALAMILGFTVVKDMFGAYNLSGKFMNPFAFAILVIIGGIILNAVGLELGHMLGGKLGGYKTISVCILGLCFYKKDGKRKVGFRDFDGLTGETVFAPKKENANPKFAIWIPFFLYAVELISCIVLYSVSRGKNIESSNPIIAFGTAGIILVTISSMMALYNFVPVKLDSVTDGYRLTLVSKPANVEAYNELMRIENLQREGKEIGEVKVFEQVTDFTASINLITVYDLLSKSDYSSALALINKMLESQDKISHGTVNRLMAQKLYIQIITLPIEEARKHYDEEVNDSVRRFISNDLSMESIRAYVLIAGVLDDSLGEVEFANSRKPKAMKRALKSRASVEETLYKQALERVKNAHPDWDMSDIIK